MLIHIHVLVKNSDNIDIRAGHPIENDMCANGVFPVPRTNFVAGASDFRVHHYFGYGGLQGTSITLGLSFAPIGDCAIPDAGEITLGKGRKGRSVQSVSTISSFRPLMNASKSNGVDGPLFSPAIRAALNASSFASWSSSSLSPARKTSLADPYRPRST
jgi:hypothetical protein